MAKQAINLGTNPNDGTGSNLRAGGLVVNNNFTEIYTALGSGTVLNIDTSGASTDQVLKFNGTKFVAGALALELSADSTPQLGGNLDVVTHSLVSTSNRNIAITPNGSGKVILDGISQPTADGSAGQFIKTDGSGNLSFDTVTSTFTLAADSGSNDTFSTGETFTVSGGTGISTTVSNNQISVALTSGNANTFIKIEDTASTQEQLNLGETLQIIGGAGITTEVGANEITVTATALTNANLSGSAAISNANLANSTVTLGNTSVALGATAATLNNLSITGTGTIDSTGQSNKIRFQYANFASLPNSTNYEGMFATTLNDYKAYFAESDSWIQILSENSSIGLHSDVDVTSVAPANEQILGWNSGQAEWEPHNVATLLTAGKSSAQVLKVEYNGSSSYRFTSHYGTTDNPTLYTFQGQTIAFDLDALGGSHPFALQTSSGAYNSGNRITTGLTHLATDGTITTGVNAQGKTSGVLYFEVPIAQATLYYVCTSHSAMNGTLTVSSKTGGAAASYSHTKATGDGTDTTFTITSGRAVDNVLVFVNGICLVPTDDYTISGTTLTFITAPANGAEITVRYLG